MNCLMSLVEELQRRKLRFCFNIIGCGEMIPELKSRLSHFIEEGSVVLHGLINDRDKINQLMRNSDLFFFPSLSEGSPRVIVEAMSQGLPVISTPVGSLPYCFKDGESIRFFDYNDYAKAADVVESYISQPAEYDTIRRNAISLVSDNYTLDKFLSTVFKYEA